MINIDIPETPHKQVFSPGKNIGGIFSTRYHYATIGIVILLLTVVGLSIASLIITLGHESVIQKSTSPSSSTVGLPLNAGGKRILQVGDAINETDGVSLSVLNSAINIAINNLEISSSTVTAPSEGTLLADGTVAMTASLDAGNYNIVNLATPTLATHAATKAYVDENTVEGTHENAITILAREKIITHRWLYSMARTYTTTEPVVGSEDIVDYALDNLMNILQGTNIRCIEIDVLDSSDGVPYVSHDNTAYTNAGISSITGATSATIDANAGSNLHNQFLKLYRVSEILGYMKPFNVVPVIEIKSPSLWSNLKNVIENEVGYPKNLIIISTSSGHEAQLALAKADGYHTMIIGNNANYPLNVASGGSGFPTLGTSLNGVYDGGSVGVNEILPHKIPLTGVTKTLIDNNDRFAYVNEPIYWAVYFNKIKPNYAFNNVPWIRRSADSSSIDFVRGNSLTNYVASDAYSSTYTFINDVDLAGESNRRLICVLPQMGFKNMYYMKFLYTSDLYENSRWAGIYITDGPFTDIASFDAPVVGLLFAIRANTNTNYFIHIYKIEGSATTIYGNIDTGISYNSASRSPLYIRWDPSDQENIYYGSSGELTEYSLTSTTLRFKPKFVGFIRRGVAGAVDLTGKGTAQISSVPIDDVY